MPTLEIERDHKRRGSVALVNPRRSGDAKRLAGAVTVARGGTAAESWPGRGLTRSLLERLRVALHRFC